MGALFYLLSPGLAFELKSSSVFLTVSDPEMPPG